MYRVPDDIRSTHQQDGAVVLDIRRGQIFGLNSVGSRILQLLEAGHDEPSIVSEITREFAVNKEIVLTDVREFVEALRRNRLVETAADRGEHSAAPTLRAGN